MGRAAAARRLAAAAAYGGGGVSALGGVLYGLLRAEAALARRAIGRLDRDPPDATGWYGRGRPGPAIKLVLLGDSGAAGYGVEHVEQTPGAHLASGLAERADRRVHLRSFALTGARSSHLVEDQVDRAVAVEPDVVVILIGVNDITGGMRPAASVRNLVEAVTRLRATGAQVVVGTCPDLGTVRPIPPPLKQIARLWSRRLATAQTIAVVEAGGRTVSLGTVLGPEFDAAPAVLFGPDGFHPSADGYRSLAAVLLPSVLAALGFVRTEELAPEAYRGEGILPVAAAAVRAVDNTGTELGGTEVGGSRRGVRGLWVEVRHRRREVTSPATAPESDHDDGDDGDDRDDRDEVDPSETVTT